ncbi:hypothetical protein ElyMa_005550200 [Elysia marginata]|uniref:Uncharacterized protein n=1 Tax=Elysia marginata TaxID=1093978 RepID=A0AAV4F027_9GAST|nr:hypothetical protein ElyMa_005550200 [Elysia marginata]
MVENIQRRATKQLPCRANCCYKDGLKALDLLRLMYRRFRGDLIEDYYLTNGLYNVNVEDYLPLRCEAGTKGHCYKFSKQACRLDVRKNFFGLGVTNTWKIWPQSTGTASSLNA